MAEQSVLAEARGVAQEGLLKRIVGYRDSGLFHYGIVPFDGSKLADYVFAWMGREEVPHQEDLRGVVLSDKRLNVDLNLLVPVSGLEWYTGEGPEFLHNNEYDGIQSHLYDLHEGPKSDSAAFAIANLRRHQTFALFLEELDKHLISQDIVVLREHICTDASKDSAVYINVRRADGLEDIPPVEKFDGNQLVIYDPEDGKLKPISIDIKDDLYPKVIYKPIDNRAPFDPSSFRLETAVSGSSANFIDILSGIYNYSEGMRKSLKLIREKHPEGLMLVGEYRMLNSPSVSGIPYAFLKPINQKY